MPLEPTEIRTIAREAMDRVNWRDKVKAKTSMWRMVKAREDADALIEELAKEAIDYIVDELWRSQSVPVTVERELGAPRLVQRSNRFSSAVEGRVREWLLDERIADGHGGNLIVRDATKVQILQYAQGLISQGTTTLRRGHYFRSVGELLKKDSDVAGKVLSETDLERLWEKQGLPLRQPA